MTRVLLRDGSVFEGSGSPPAKAGTLEPGKVADVVVLAGDALDLRDLAGRVRRVYQDGTLVSEGRPPARSDVGAVSARR
jgi:cytosine/adenosine deaminase-related metal-dependent hydrolase